MPVSHFWLCLLQVEDLVDVCDETSLAQYGWDTPGSPCVTEAAEARWILY